MNASFLLPIMKDWEKSYLGEDFVWLNDNVRVFAKQYGTMSGKIWGKNRDYESFNKKDLRLV